MYLSNPGFKTTSLLNQHIKNNDKAIIIPIIILACWLLNHLNIQGYGLYHDDLPAIADYTKLTLFNIVNSPFDWLRLCPHGRPLGWFFLPVLGGPGRSSGELETCTSLASLS